MLLQTPGFCDILFLPPMRLFGDDIADRCAECKASIFVRPHDPINAKWMCWRCATLVLETRGGSCSIPDKRWNDLMLLSAAPKGHS